MKLAALLWSSECSCSVTLTRDTVGLSAVCDGVVSKPLHSLIFEYVISILRHVQLIEL